MGVLRLRPMRRDQCPARPTSRKPSSGRAERYGVRRRRRIVGRGRRGRARRPAWPRRRTARCFAVLDRVGIEHHVAPHHALRAERGGGDASTTISVPPALPVVSSSAPLSGTGHVSPARSTRLSSTGPDFPAPASRRRTWPAARCREPSAAGRHRDRGGRIGGTGTGSPATACGDGEGSGRMARARDDRRGGPAFGRGRRQAGGIGGGRPSLAVVGTGAMAAASPAAAGSSAAG